MTKDLSFCVNIDSPIAVYVQIENQIQFAITSGAIKKGDTLPSVREMSAMLDVNPNTVTKSYRDLELMGLVKTRRGVGVTITDDASKRCSASTRKMVMAHLTDAVAESMASGIKRGEIEKVVKQTIDTGRSPYTS